MSGAVGSFGTLASLLGGLSAQEAQYTTLQQQTSTGKVATSYAGLGTASGRVLDLTAATSRSDAYGQVIANAQSKASVMQDALTQIQSVVSSMAASALSLSTTPQASAVDSAATQAKQALSQIAALLNTQNGSEYVFSGADSSNPPIPSPNSIMSSGLYTQIGVQVAALATTPSSPPVATVIANTVAIAQSTTPGTTVFSSYLAGAGATAAPGTVQVSDNQSVSVDLPANRNVGATSDPSINGTGSAIGDILRSLSVIANSSGSLAGNPDLGTLMSDASKTLTSANATVAAEAGQLGLTQNTLTAAASSQTSLKTALAKQLSGLTDVDMASTISKLQTVGSQLQASYNVLSVARTLNLASYLQ